MASPEKKRKKMEEEPSPTTQILTQNSSLPDDLLISCIARTSRLYYPTLSLVSKSFRSLLAEPELYKVRSMLGHTESCLYVCLQSSSEYGLFTLCRKPAQTLANKEKKKSSGYVLVRVPTHHYLREGSPVLVAVGSDIYKIGSGSNYFNEASSNVSILDCRFHTWHEAPSMPVELTSPSASVVDRKIYVAGSHGDSFQDSLDSFAVFDTATQIWDSLPSTCSKTRNSILRTKTACFDGKFHVYTDQGVCGYNSKESRWDLTEPKLGHALLLLENRTCCVIENVLYSAYHGWIEWYDNKVLTWKKLKGLIGPEFARFTVRLADYGGKMAVLWEEKLPRSGEKMIWCAEIALERSKNHGVWGENFEIWGEVEWFDHVLTVPKGYDLVKVLAATV